MSVCSCTLIVTHACDGCPLNSDYALNFNKCIDAQPYTKTTAVSRLLEKVSIEPLDPQITKIVSENFWELI